MNSIEKVYGVLEDVANMEDSELSEAMPGNLPITPALARTFLPTITGAIPSDPDELDEFLKQVGDFCYSLRSDPIATA